VLPVYEHEALSQFVALATEHHDWLHSPRTSLALACLLASHDTKVDGPATLGGPVRLATETKVTVLVAAIFKAYKALLLASCRRTRMRLPKEFTG